MKKGLKTVLLSGLTLILLAGMCIGVSAAEMLYEEYGAYVNPAYADVLGEDDLGPLRVANGLDDEFIPEDYETDFDSAVQSIIEKLVNRDISISVKFRSENLNGEDVCIALLDAAVAHTGTPWEGDYIRYTYGGYQFSIGGWQTEDAFYYNFTYAPTYFTNLEQEDFVDAEVTAILDDIITAGMADYQKICAIYDYITENVIYDYDHLEDESYKLQYTAYAALHDGTAVCQGYANLFYRMVLEAGVDARIISGYGGDEETGGPHAWNIVGLDESWYNLDATWDAGMAEYEWFLRGDASFPDHIRDEMYSTEAFYEEYLMSEEDYVFPEAWSVEDDSLNFIGTPIGSDCWDDNNPFFAFDKVFDGSIDTYYDAAYSASPDMYVGLDMGEDNVRLTRVDVFPRINQREHLENRMRGLRIQGSPDGMQWLTLYTFPEDDYGFKTYSVTWDDFDEELRDYQFKAFRLTNYDDHLNLAEAAFYGDDEGEPMTETYFKLIPITDVVNLETGESVNGFPLEINSPYFSCQESWSERGITYRGEFGDEITYFIAESYVPAMNEDDYFAIPGEIDGKTIVGIAPWAFYGNLNLGKVEVKENIRWIMNLAFMNCSNLEVFAIPHSLRHTFGDAWADCDNFREFLYTDGWGIDYEFTDEEYDRRGGLLPSIEDGVLYLYHDASTLVRYPNAHLVENDTFVTAENVTWINSGAFQDVKSLRSIILTNVNGLADNAFAFSSIETVTLSPNLEVITGGGVFNECWNLRMVELQNPDCFGALDYREDYDPDDPERREESEVYRFNEVNLFNPDQETVVYGVPGGRWEEYVNYLHDDLGYRVTFETLEGLVWETECPDGSVRLDTDENRFGTDSWESNPDVSFDKAFDGDVNTFYDAAEGATPYMYFGTDLGEGESARLTRVDIFPRINQRDRMRGLRIQGSPDGMQWLTLYTFPEDDYELRTYTVTWDDFAEELRNYQFKAFRLTNYDEHLNAAEVAFYGDGEGEPLTEAYFKLVPTMEMVERNNYDNDIFWQEDEGWFFFCGEDTFEDGRVTYRGTFGDTETFFITEAYLPYQEDGIYVIPGEYDGRIIAGIGEDAFFGNKDIKNLVIAENICWIESCAFHSCENMVTCAIPYSLRWAHGLAWAECHSFEEFLYTGDWIEDYPTDDEYFREADRRGGHLTRIHDGVLYMYHDNALIRYPNNRPAENDTYEVTIGSQIGGFAFADTVSLKSVVLPHVERIEWGAFAWSSLESVAISHDVNWFDGDVFIDCWNLTEVIAYDEYADGAMEYNWDYNPDDPNWNEESEVYRFRNVSVFSPDMETVVYGKPGSRWEEYVNYLHDVLDYQVTFATRLGEWETECPDGSVRLDTEDNRFGTDSWESNPDVSFDKAFDGDINTFYDAAEGATPYMYIGTDLGEGNTSRLTRVDIYPRIDCPDRMRGLRIQGSPDGMQWLTLYTCPDDIYVARTYTATLDDFDEELRDMQFRAFRITNYDGHLSAAEVAFYGDEEGEPMNLNEAYYKLVPTMEMVERNNYDNDIYWQEDEGWFFFCGEDTFEDGRVTYRGTFGDTETYFITESYLPYHADGKYVIPGEYNDKIIAGIGVRAFHDCKDIRNLVISENICWIEDCAFQGCDNMVTCAIPESLRWAHGIAWANCYSFEEFLYTGDWIEKYPTDDEYYRAADTRGGRMMRIHDGVLYMYHDSVLVRYPNNRPAENGIFVVPNVNGIGSHAFQDTVSLKSVVMPHVNRIDWNAFAWSSVEYVAIPASVNWLDGDAFYDCWNLKKVIALNWYADGAMEDNWDYNPDDPNWNEESEVYRFRNMNLFNRWTPVVVSARKDSRWEEYVTYLQEQGYAVTFEEMEYPGWLYGVNDWDEVEIYGYFDNADVLEIPAEIDGMPVVRVNQLVHSVDYAGAEPVRDLIFPEADIFIENWLYNEEYSGLETVTLPAGSHYLNLATFNRCNNLTDVYYTGEWLDVWAYGWGYADDEFRIREDDRKIKLHCSDGCEINFKHINIENDEMEFGDYSIDDNPYIEVIRDVDTAMEVKPISSVEVYTDPLYPGRTSEDFGVWCRDGRYHITDYELNGKQPFVEENTYLLTVRLAPNDGYEFGEFVEGFANGRWVDSAWCESEESVMVQLSLSVGYSSMEKAADALGLEPITEGYRFVDGSWGFDGEEAWNLWDNDPETKFCTDSLTAWSYIELDEPASINGVILTTANDSEEFRGRLPGEWRILGSNDGEHWDEIYCGEASAMMDTNFLSYVRTFAPSAPYRYYSFEAYWTDSGNFQLADVTLCETNDAAAKGLAYEEYADHCVVTGIGSFTGNLVIPAEHNGKPVTEIGENAFELCKNLTSVVIPDSVTSIGYRAFRYCSGLTSITIPNSVTSIGGFAFAICANLTSITIPDSVTSIGDGAFRYCISLTSITIPNSVTSIGGEVFYDCTSLTSITIPNSVTSIVAWTFNNCASLTDVYYIGTEAEWNALKQNIGDGNEPLLNATIHFVTPADDELVISAESVTGYVGKTVRVPIILSDNPGLVSLTLNVSYDTDVFTLIGVEDSELLPGGMHSDRYVSPYYLVWENDTARENFTVNGTVAELVFAVADDAPEGDYTIEITCPKDGVMNSAGDSVECRLVSGVCTVSDYILGDVNGDGDVTNKDRLILARYLADWEGYELSDMVFGAADINGDGELTNKDRLILARHLADWEGYGDLSSFRQ